MRQIMPLAGVVSMLLVLGALPAEATFPGENGKIAFYVFDTDTTHVFAIEPSGDDRVNVTPLTSRDS